VIRLTLPRFILQVALVVLFVGPGEAAQTRAVAPAMIETLLASPLVTPPAGDAHGDVTLVEYFDYNCPICRALEPQLERLLATDRKVRLVRKDWPIFGDVSRYAAYCSFAASGEGKYRVAHHALIASSRSLDSKEDVLSVLQAAGLDIAKLESDVASHEKEYAQTLARNRHEAQALGLRGTPGIIVGDQLVLDGVDYHQLQLLVARVRQQTGR